MNILRTIEQCPDRHREVTMEGIQSHPHWNVPRRRYRFGLPGTLAEVYMAVLVFLSLLTFDSYSQSALPLNKTAVFESENYPNSHYLNNSIGNWSAEFAELSLVRFEFKPFLLEHTGPACKGDWVMVYKGRKIREENLVGKKLCGNLTGGVFQVDEPTYYLVVTFYSDASVTDKGFHMEYTAYPHDPGQTCRLMRRGRGETVEISSRVIGFQEDKPSWVAYRFPKAVDCIWNVTTDIEHEFEIEFSLVRDMSGDYCTQNLLEVQILPGDLNEIEVWELMVRDEEDDIWAKTSNLRKTQEGGKTVLLGRYCGHEERRLVYKTNAERLTVRFRNYISNDKGYFRFTKRPIDKARAKRTSPVEHVELLNELYLGGPTPSESTDDPVIWIIQSFPGFVILFEFNSTEETRIEAYDSPTTDMNRRLDFRRDQNGSVEGSATGFYLSVLCKSHDATCPRVKYEAANVFDKLLVPTKLGNFSRFDYIIEPPSCCKYEQFNGANSSILISSILAISVKANTDNCRYFGVVVFDGNISRENRHGPYCEEFDGNVEFVLNNLVSNTDTIYVVAYMYGDQRPYSRADGPVLSFVLSSSECTRLDSVIVGSNLLNFTVNHSARLDPEGQDKCISFYLSNGTTNIMPDQLPEYCERSWSLLCTNITTRAVPAFDMLAEVIGDLSGPVGDVFIASNNTPASNVTPAINATPRLLTEPPLSADNVVQYLYSQHGREVLEPEHCMKPETFPSGDTDGCTNPRLRKVLLGVEWSGKVQDIHCNQNYTFSDTTTVNLALVADERHDQMNCSWSVSADSLRQWGIHFQTLSAKEGTALLEIHEIFEQPQNFKLVTPFYSYRYPRYYQPLGSRHLKFEASTTSRLEMLVFVTPEPSPRIPGELPLDDRIISPNDTCLKGICYELFTDPGNITWINARELCRSLDRDSHLLSVNSQEELDFIRKLMATTWRQAFLVYGQPNMTFIGLKGTNQQTNPYRWSNNSPLSFVDFFNPFNDLYHILPTTPDVFMENLTTIQPTANLDQACIGMIIGNPYYSSNWRKIPCFEGFTPSAYICETVPERNITSKRNVNKVKENCRWYQYKCKDGTCLNRSLRCDGDDDCPDGDDEQDCEDNFLFECDNKHKIQVSLCCDNRDDCGDESDEYWCDTEDCPDFRCPSSFCISNNLLCNGIEDCLGGRDEVEEICPNGKICDGHRCRSGDCIFYHKQRDMVADCVGPEQFDERYDFSINWPNDPKGGQLVHSNNITVHCHGRDDETRCRPWHEHCYPNNKKCVFEVDYQGHMKYCRGGEHLLGCENHTCTDMFKCPESYCVPHHLVCDTVPDCPDLSDELECENHTCPGLLRCKEKVCVLQDEVCDGIIHCKKSIDDERFCEFHSKSEICPDKCTCDGYHMHCIGQGLSCIPHAPNKTRALSLSHNLFEDLPGNVSYRYLITIDMSHNRIVRVDMDAFRGFPNLVNIKLNHNLIKTFDNTTFFQIRWLKRLDLQFNPISDLEENLFTDLANLVKLNISYLLLETLRIGVFTGLRKLKILDLSGNRLKVIEPESLSQFERLIVLNITNNHDLKKLENGSLETVKVTNLFTDSYRFCCHVESQNVPNCQPQRDADFFSSCEEFLKNRYDKGMVWAVGTSSLAGNAMFLVWRVRTGLHSVPSMLVANLCASDFLMGLFLCMIGTADTYYGESEDFYWENPVWRDNLFCKLAGVLGVVSRQMSLMIMVLLIIERFLKHMEPFGKTTHEVGPWIWLVVLAWLLSIGLAVFPFSFPSHHAPFYGRNVYCAPFLFTDLSGPSMDYAWALFTVTDCVGVFVVGFCYRIIRFKFNSINRKSEEIRLKEKFEKHLTQKLLVIIGTDFMMWIPVILLLLAVRLNSRISGLVSSVVIYIVLPLNASTNPLILYLTRPQKKKIKKPATVDAKAAGNVDVQPGAKVDNQPEVKFDDQPGAKDDVKPGAKVDVKCGAKGDDQPGAKDEVRN